MSWWRGVIRHSIGREVDGQKEWQTYELSPALRDTVEAAYPGSGARKAWMRGFEDRASAWRRGDTEPDCPYAFDQYARRAAWHSGYEAARVQERGR